MEKSVNTREVITDMLREICEGRSYSHVLIRDVLNKYDFMKESDKAFIKRVTEGVLEREIQIDYVLDLYSKTPVHKMRPFIRSLMRMSVYQILFLDKVPDSAVCNEAVKLAQKRNFKSLKGYVNALLRTISRQKERIPYPNEADQPVKSYSIRYSMPEFIVKMMMEQYGKELSCSMFEGMLRERRICVRMCENILERQKEEAIEEWMRRGISFKQHPWLSYAYILNGTDALFKLNGFLNGSYTVQDISSMLVCECAGIRKGDYVLDVCAAPGGKALHAYDKLAQTGTVEARDVSLNRVQMIDQGKERMHADQMRVIVWDAVKKDEKAVGLADVLLLDIPCSGIGVIGRKPDIKYHLTKQSLDDLYNLQKRIIDTVWEYVKPGGTLLYSTCTIRHEENEDMVQYIMANYPFEPVSLDSCLKKELHSKDTKTGVLKLLPLGECDGFFIAKMKRKEENDNTSPIGTS